MEAADSKTIADLSSECQQTFLCLKHEISAEGNSKLHDRGAFPGFSPENHLDAFARFRVWVGNIGALKRDRSSLDYRLRHSAVKDEVARLLSELSSALTDRKLAVTDVWRDRRKALTLCSFSLAVLSLVVGERKQQTWYDTDVIAIEDSDDDSDSTESETCIDIAKTDPVLQTESAQLNRIIDDVIASLFKLSVVIQQSSRRAKFARSSKERPFNARFDILHIQESFPYVTSNNALLEKLGKANAQRRQWLSYRRRHHEKLSSDASSTRENLSYAPNMSLDDLYSESRGSNSLSLSASSQDRRSSTSFDKSTAATTFCEEGHQFHEEYTDGSVSETAYSSSSVSESANQPTLIPQPPPESSDGRPFECPFCYRILTIETLQMWIKHVHADLASYVCTFEHCTQPLFESRRQWFHHEMEAHRKTWLCPFCDCSVSSPHDLESHLAGSHRGFVGDDQISSLVQLASQPLKQIPASACPLCDYNALLQARLGVSKPINVKAAQFGNHLGRHLEQLALFVLPKSSLVHDSEDEAPLRVPSEAGSAGSAVSGNDCDDSDDEGDQQSWLSANTETLLDDVFAALTASDTDTPPHILKSVPDLALRWQPPHDFTPPAAAFDTDDSDLMPRREEPTFGGDLFTPGWVRGFGKRLEGYCARCQVGHWVNIPDGTYEVHLTFLHGIPSTGLPLPRPSTVKEATGRPGVWEGYCDECQGWRVLKKTSRGWNWFRHFLTEHKSALETLQSTKPIGAIVASNTGPSLLSDAIGYIRRGYADAYKSLIKREPRIIQQQSSNCKTVLHFAAESGSIDLVRFTLEVHSTSTSADAVRRAINAQTSFGMTPLMLAAGQGNQEVIEELLMRGADTSFTNAEDETALDLATEAGYISILKLLIKNGAGIQKSKAFRKIFKRRAGPSELHVGMGLKHSNAPESHAAGWDNLMVNAYDNNIIAVKQCLASGCDVEATAPDGRTALMIAASRGNTKVVEMLLDMGANIDTTNNKGWTTLQIAVKDGDLSMARLLLSHGADVNHSSPDRWTALALAAQQGRTDIMQALLACGADTEARSSHDWTPLMHACFIGTKQGVDLLLDAGASVESGSQRDESPILLAAAAGNTDIVRTLLDAGCLPESNWARAVTSPGESGVDGGGLERAYHLGWTPLMVACQRGHEEIVRLLLQAGANVKPRSPMERTALEIARENGRTKIALLLQEHTVS